MTDDEKTIRVEDLEYVDINCADCEEHLYNLVKIKDSDKDYKIIVECPFCEEGASWEHHIQGDYIQAPPEDLILEDTREENDKFYITLKGIDDA